MIRVSLRLGAMVAGADADQLAALDAYGRRLGLAFQITDDLLDVQSSEAATGKRVGKDAERGKLTFPGLLGLDQSAQHAEQLIAGGVRGPDAAWAREPTGFGRWPDMSWKGIADGQTAFDDQLAAGPQKAFAQAA